MFLKDISQITLQDVIDLVEIRKENESQHLDYKKDVSHPDKAKNEIAKDISSFANASGGYLILGVDDEKKIIGIDKQIQNKPAKEWINQILSSNLEPRVQYPEPRIFELNETNKIVVVIYVPESLSKPHMVKDKHSYFIRVNEQCLPANHYSVRDMFELSKTRNEAANLFLQQRNLSDENSADFGINTNSVRLANFHLSSASDPVPMFLISF